MGPGANRPVRRRQSAAVDGPSSTAPIRTRALTKRYGERIAVDALDLEVRAGEIFGLLGQNGAGKTTTILMLLGLTEPSGGGARVVGLDPSRHPLEVKRRVGYLPDAVGFYGNMTGRENLRYTARLNGLRGADAEVHIETVLEQVGLTDRADGRTDTYSRGMLQRLGIADALIKEPDVLILDEPTASIDPIGVIEILDLLRRLARERGMTVLLSSHLLDQVQSICDRVGIFASGRLIGVGTVAELATKFGDGAAHLDATFVDGAPDPSAALRAIPGVIDVARDPADGTWRIAVRPATASTRVREAIVEVAGRNGLRMTSLREREPSLEDIYRAASRAIARPHGEVAA
ncbi:MAG: ABC transporter ATP-binding protein [Chloroflexi bacterium]|nr:ABC transporter ATP-binding protein [Chloroflexota bacterium]